MRKGGMTFDEREAFGADVEAEVSANYDQSLFWRSFYAVDSGGIFDDRSTIGHMVTRAAARFHYNAVENAIIRALAHREPPPYGSSVRLWEFAQMRRDLRLLDIGSGTGHWIDFFMESQYVSLAVGLEVATNIAAFLREKYSGCDGVQILETDIAAHDCSIEGRFDYVSAIGVMFHITDDEKWLSALRNIRSVLAPNGLLFVGGDFRWETKNIQFHRIDKFDDWREQQFDGAINRAFVNKRVRSLAEWHRAADSAGLAIADLVRVDSDWAVHTPENDLLVLIPAPGR